jgi:hypothetical protein
VRKKTRELRILRGSGWLQTMHHTKLSFLTPDREDARFKYDDIGVRICKSPKSQVKSLKEGVTLASLKTIT